MKLFLRSTAASLCCLAATAVAATSRPDGLEFPAPKSSGASSRPALGFKPNIIFILTGTLEDALTSFLYLPACPLLRDPPLSCGCCPSFFLCAVLCLCFTWSDDQDTRLSGSNDTYDAFGSLHAMPKTMARFVEGGAHFSNAFVNTPICCPSRTEVRYLKMHVHVMHASAAYPYFTHAAAVPHPPACAVSVASLPYHATLTSCSRFRGISSCLFSLNREKSTGHNSIFLKLCSRTPTL